MKNNKIYYFFKLILFFCEQPIVYITIFTKYDKMIIQQLSQAKLRSGIAVGGLFFYLERNFSYFLSKIWFSDFI